MKKPLSLTEIEESAVVFKSFRKGGADNEEGLVNALRVAVREELTPAQRRVVLMYYGERMKILEIAKKERVTESAVSHRLRRARKALYRYLKYYSGSPPD